MVPRSGKTHRADQRRGTATRAAAVGGGEGAELRAARGERGTAGGGEQLVLAGGGGRWRAYGGEASPRATSQAAAAKFPLPVKFIQAT